MTRSSRPASTKSVDSPIELQGELTAAEKALDAAIAALEVLPRASKRGITPLVEDAFTRVRNVKEKLAALLLHNAAIASPLIVTGPPAAPFVAAESSNVHGAPAGASQGASHSSKRNSPAHRRRRNNRRRNGAK